MLWGINMRSLFILFGVSITISIPAFADMPTDFPIHPKEPIPKITKSEGIGTKHAKLEAKIGQEELQDWCENWKPGDTACTEEALNSYGNDIYTASANCQTGELTDPNGNSKRSFLFRFLLWHECILPSLTHTRNERTF